MVISAVLVNSDGLQVMIDAPILEITGGFNELTTTLAKAIVQLLASRILIVTAPGVLVA
ncbi:hypothetical protein D3C85_452200 [compost metagenome]